MLKNTNSSKAKNDDELFTRLGDIEKELSERTALWLFTA